MRAACTPACLPRACRPRAYAALRCMTLKVWGSGANEARVYERESGELRGVMKGMQQGVYSLDCHPSMSQVAVASGDGAVRLYDYK